MFSRLFCIGFLCLTASIATAQNQITLNVDQSEHQISRHIYGHFSEHLGRCIYGGFYVGDDHELIPNNSGIRSDVVEALKQLQIPNLRWPGGCFADTYHWKDGIGPQDQRPTIVNTWWGGITEDNSFGTHEFLDLCDQLNTEPFISGNVGSGTVQELSDWIQYTNGTNESPMSKLRSQNGRQEAWDVKYWGVGNEAWGCGGNMRPEYYADLYRQYATYMNTAAKGSSIYRIAAGGYSNHYTWTEVLMKNIPLKLMEGISLHHYSVLDWSEKGPSTTFNLDQYFLTMQKALAMETHILKHSTIMDQYDPDQTVGLIVDEWGGWYEVEPGTNPGFLYQQNTMRDAMIAGVTLNIFNNHCDRVKMANLAQTINVLQAVILTDEEKMILTPTYHVFDLYKVHQDAMMIPLYVKSEDFENGDHQLKTISASASINEEKEVHVSVVNIHATEFQEIEIMVNGMSFEKMSGQILTAEKLQTYNTFESPDQIKIREFTGATKTDGIVQLSIPPFSMVVLKLK